MSGVASSPCCLSGKVCIVTGGSTGIGWAIVDAFLESGAKGVILTGRRTEEDVLQEEAPVKTKISERCVYLQVDHRDSEQCAGCVDEAVRRFGRIDILVNNAGVVVRGCAEEISDTLWDDVFAINVRAVWKMSALVIPHMRRARGGCIVNIASDWGLIAAEDALLYCATKASVVQMTKCMALDYARQGIRVNAICPGDTFVERWSREGYFSNDPDPIPPECVKDALQSDDIPMGRVAHPQEIAHAVLFVASNSASYMTGACIPVDGGTSAK